ncbi:AmmeMemoRadiSam system protein B [Abditibacterium utsteinense]|nr:AmmeMemoRadiSam system protein B [Abditibacterium utsteinense]
MNFSHPRLRVLQISPVSEEGEEWFHFHDRSGIAPDVRVPREFGPILSLCDGSRDTSEILRLIQNQQPDVSSEWLENLLSDLDELFLLDSPRFGAREIEIDAQFSSQSVRPSALAGRSYPENPAQLRQLLEQKLKLGKQRLPTPIYDAQQVRGIVTPHIDFTRGGHVEAASYEPLVQNVRATGKPFDTLVILGIAHNGISYPFCGTAQDFETPLGTAKCDFDFLSDLKEIVGPQLMREQIAHQNEHSVEFSAVFTQFFEELRASKIVPILCGGFWQSLQSGESPQSAQPEVENFIAALREVTKNHEDRGKKIGFIASVDGAHVGSQFGDETPITPRILQKISDEDAAWISAIESGDKAKFHAHFTKNENAFNVDAHPALYTLMAAFPTLRGQKLDYDQAFNANANIVVSFASLALFERNGE